MKHSTIKDVAKQANVSTTTVSHVINNTRYVAKSTREAVEKAMEDLGYQPNFLARSLRSGETNTIGLIVPDGANPFFADISRRIEDLGYDNGYSVIQCNSDQDLNKQRSYIKTLIAKQIDGVIFISSGDSDDDLKLLTASNIPVVVVDRSVPLNLADMILVNNEQAGYEATRHLLDLGHQRIACISGPMVLGTSRLRFEGYKRALDEADIILNPDYILESAYTLKGGQQAMEKLLNVNPSPTAIFALNDLIAFGVIYKARHLGFNIPEDFSIIGFDDIELAAAFTPSLTTIAQPLHEIAKLAVDRLFEKMQTENGDWENKQIMLDAKIIIRESTIPLKTLQEKQNHLTRTH